MTMENRSEKLTGFVFIHGAGFEEKIWNDVVEGLDHPWFLIKYPFREKEKNSRLDLHLEDYVTYIVKQLKTWEVESFIIVAHSLGGVFALRLAEELPDRVAGFAAVGAAIPKNGGSYVSILPFPKRRLSSVILKKWGTKPPESAIRKGLCNDLSENQAAAIVEGFIPEAFHVYTERTESGIPPVPRLYVKLTKDREFNKALQKKMIKNLSPQSVQQLETGHLPMLSDPEGLRRILLTFLNDEVSMR